jgi:hypothetical protein
MPDAILQHALKVKKRHEHQLMRKANVLAVGVGYRVRSGQQTQEICITVSVRMKLGISELKKRDLIPATIENVPVDVIETGTIRSF